MVDRKVLVSFVLKTAVPILDNGKIVNSKEKENIYLLMEVHI